MEKITFIRLDGTVSEYEVKSMPNLKWKPYSAPLFDMSNFKKEDIIDLTKDIDKYKFKLPTQNMPL
jgi:hypothetical protein